MAAVMIPTKTTWPNPMTGTKRRREVEDKVARWLPVPNDSDDDDDVQDPREAQENEKPKSLRASTGRLRAVQY